MKNYILLLTITGIIFLNLLPTTAQIIDPAEKAEKEGEKRVNKSIDKGIDKGFDAIEGGLKGVFGKGKKSTADQKVQQTPKQETTVKEPDPVTVKTSDYQQTDPSLSWAKYDFVPGDKVIFEDNLIGEENGEFPSRWDLVRGNVEISKVDGDNVIMMRDGAPSIVPYLKDSRIDYLPDVFTVELDLYYPGDGNFEIYLFDRKNQKSGSPSGYTYLQVQYNQMFQGQARSTYPDDNLAKSRWMHIAIAYTNGKLKAYMDDTRLINIPRLDFDPKGLTLYTYHARNDNIFYVKNVRIAEGGVKYYDRLLQDGKIIASGIRFDINKATIKPESMGVINEIFTLMKDHQDISFSVEGHTDSDGDNDLNQKLSEERAKAVLEKLVSMGIERNRLTAKGFGESNPIAANSTEEGKANNRRVEFVKM